MFDVCVVGSANLDLVATTRRLPEPGETVLGSAFAEHAGGKGLNQAIAARRAGAGVAFVGAVGRDPAGRWLLDELAREGVDAAGVREDRQHPTGRALIVVDAGGENSIVVVAGANSTVRADQLPPARVILVQLEIPLDAVETALVVAHDRGAVAVLNPAPAADLPRALLALADVVVPNEHEVRRLGGPEALLAAGAGTVVTTLGAEGVEVTSAERTWRHPAHRVAVVDATAAGDAFCGALAARLALGDPIEPAVQFATAAGARWPPRRPVPSRRSPTLRRSSSCWLAPDLDLQVPAQPSGGRRSARGIGK